MTRSLITTRCLAVVLLGLAAACAKRGNNDAADTEGNAMPDSGAVGAGMIAEEISLIVAPGATFITDSKGRTVYFLEGPDGAPIVQCTGECATAFDPVTGKAVVATGDSTIQVALISDIVLPTGEQQITYNGRPLYFMKDGQTGSATVRASRVSPSGNKAP